MIIFDFCIYSVYLPCECHNNLDDYIDHLAKLENVINETECTVIYTLCDFNCDIMEGSLFSKYLSDFVNDVHCVFTDNDHVVDG